ncbi:S-adenosylmethionine--2-demethylmenaquinone methyltransferase [Synergistales bacterium]|nr:S-adenosylmethionine--2-demethylmenaquinone methyltransferase [Synergistales bacterium]
MYDVIKRYAKPAKELIESFLKIEESASLLESMPNKDGALHSSIRPVLPEKIICGSALTVQCGIGDNIMLHRAIDMIQPGDVLMVINGGYDEAGGMFGGMMAASCKAKGAAGLVIEGGCRDTVLIKKLGFPVFSKNITVKATTKLCPGRINHPIVIGGVYVKPGDVVFGDADSVVVIPLEDAEEVLKIAAAREEKEEGMLKKILAGEGTTFTFAGFNKIYEKLNLSEEPD